MILLFLPHNCFFYARARLPIHCFDFILLSIFRYDSLFHLLFPCCVAVLRALCFLTKAFLFVSNAGMDDFLEGAFFDHILFHFKRRYGRFGRRVFRPHFVEVARRLAPVDWRNLKAPLPEERLFLIGRVSATFWGPGILSRFQTQVQYGRFGRGVFREHFVEVAPGALDWRNLMAPGARLAESKGAPEERLFSIGRVSTTFWRWYDVNIEQNVVEKRAWRVSATFCSSRAWRL